MACEMCYRRKIKCEFEGSNPVCAQCRRRNTKCVFDRKNTKRDSLKRKQYIRSLEERVERIQALLKAAGILNEEAVNQDELLYEDEDEQSEEDHDFIEGVQQRNANSTQPNGSRRNANHGNKSGISTPTDSVTAQSNHKPNCSSSSNPQLAHGRCSTCDLQYVPLIRADSREDLRYYGRSSSLSILSREGVEWIKKRTGDTSFLNVIYSDSLRDDSMDCWRPDVFHDLFASQVYKPLPPRAEVFALLQDYFCTVNRLFPLYHKPTFMRLIEWQYTQQTCDDAARWASLNIIIALAYEFRFSNSQKPEKDREKALLYFKNAMSVFTELTFRRTDLLSVQALLGMAMFLRGNTDSQTASPVLTAALASCHRMGLHRNILRPGLSPAEQEQRKRVFWIAYILDQSIRLGSAPAQNLDDFDVDYPQAESDEESLSEDSSVYLGFFRQFCLLSVIRGRIYVRLYGANSFEQRPADICEAVHELSANLEEWWNECPFQNQFKLKPGAPDFLFGLASIGLRLVYYNSLIMIHRMLPLLNVMVGRNSMWRSKLHIDMASLDNQASSSSAICLQAARDSLKLVNHMPWGDVSWLWPTLYYVFHAVMIIFVNVLANQRPLEAREDLHSLNMAATFFTTLTPVDGAFRYSIFMSKMAVYFERMARMVVERNEKENRSLKGSNNNVNPNASPTMRERRPRNTPPSERTAQSRRLDRRPGPTFEAHSPNDLSVNSAGYAIPGSPATLNVAMHANDYFQVAQGMPVTSANEIPNFNAALDHSSFTFADNSGSPSTAASVIPEFWHVPLTADWEFGFPDQSFGDMYIQTHAHPQPQPQPPPPQAHQYPLSTMATTEPSLHVPEQSAYSPDSWLYTHSNSNINNNVYGNAGLASVSVPPQDPFEGGNVVWTDGFMDSY
ncbi:hypothetical protein MPDQ_006562 [Monascus purpureus]|uniref:Zn(2)-C6 fungal-type domain-containing protein n=1 Tax=Monascus purpureus TaxID=5098 RepID=A0A507QW69_MONPU|nr:hypothetical protein MPDQ_006562 [Monascus purpureus]